MKPPLCIALYVIIDPEHTRERDVVDCAIACARGGATIIQYRDKKSDTRNLIQNAKKIKQALEKHRIPLLINDRVDVALASDADGVHLGQSDMHPQDARRLLGADKIIGLTIKTSDQAIEATRLPLDYGCIGGVFATTSKHNAEPPLGLEGLKALVKIVREHSTTLPTKSLPLGAIAGITFDNFKSVFEQGVDGIALLSAITHSDDMETATRRFVR